MQPPEAKDATFKVKMNTNKNSFLRCPLYLHVILGVDFSNPPLSLSLYLSVTSSLQGQLLVNPAVDKDRDIRVKPAEWRCLYYSICFDGV